MADPFDQDTSAVAPPPAPRVAEPSIGAWDDVPPTGVEPNSARRRLLFDLAVSLAALAALVILSLFRAGRQPDLEPSERLAYAFGAVLFGLLISLAARWLWLRVRRRSDPTASLLSPWIPVGAVILVVLSIFGGNQT
jgi:hypothetical protein